MKFIKMTVQFDAQNISLAEELICNIFFSSRLKGVVCDVPLDEPDEGFGTQTLPKPKVFSVTGYFPQTDTALITIDRLKKKLVRLDQFDISTRTFTETVDEKDWADAWKAYFDVTRITDRIVVKPEWKPYSPKENDIVLHLDPGMAFGTGTHPTTAMCLELIEEFLAPGSNVLDVGCGSGILMIAARKFGASRLLGIDTDEVALEISKQNLDKNKIAPSVYSLACSTLDKTNLQCWDLITANIIAQVIVDIAPLIAQRMHKASVAVVSGIIREREADVLAALERSGLYVEKEKNIDEWVALVLKKIND